MNFEPQKFFIGLVDFFSVLMPGALLAYLSMLLGDRDLHLDSAEAWMVFGFASYLMGHFVFLFGAALDHWIYDRLREGTDWGQIRRLANGGDLSDQRLRALAKSSLLFGQNADAAVMQAQRLKARALQKLSAESAINSYQWCKAYLSKDHPEGLLMVQRFEADSKFFRSFSVVLAILSLIFAYQLRGFFALGCAILLLPAMWRFVDQRFKATQQAYWLVITLAGAKDSSPVPNFRSEKPTHAAGVVFRKTTETVEYLLVRATNQPGQWVLPKGHIEPGEDPRETAVREVKEETDYWARVTMWIEDLKLTANNNSSVVRFYLMECMEDEKPAKNGWAWARENRGQKWAVLTDAKKQASFDESRTLLEKAETLRRECDRHGARISATTEISN